MPRSFKYTLGVLGTLLLIVAAQAAWYEYRVWYVRGEIYTRAKQFGLLPEAELVSSRTCVDPSLWIPPSAECYVLVVFRTDATLTAFQDALANRGMNPSKHGGVWPLDLYRYINRVRNSAFTLTVDGSDGRLIQDQSKFSDIRGDRWNLYNTTIEFFDLMSIKSNVELNGEPFIQNIVIIRMGVGRHSSLVLLLNPNNSPE